MKLIILLLAGLFTLQGTAKADEDRAISVEQLPSKAQQFIKQYFPKNEIALAKVEKDFWDRKYEVVFVNGEKAEFSKNGTWEKIDCKYSAVPEALIPSAILEYIRKHYDNVKVLKIEKDSKTWEIRLNNRVELEFNHAFQLIDIDI